VIHQRFQELLKRSIGLDVKSVGDTAVLRAVEHRARNCDMDDLELYLDKVINDRAELQALVETVVVPETWFFRDPEAFAVAANMLRQAWPRGAPFRLLSLPCSTGEEPYTMAMALIDAGLPPEAFRILAIDVSNAALHRARSGIYGRNSFRGGNLAYRDRHFSDTGQGFRISDEVRSSVRFSQGNIFELADLASESFDIVFCRNLMIYFDSADQKRAAATLKELVCPEGALFVGHSETRVMAEAGLTSLRIPNAFAFRKAAAAPKALPATTPSKPKARPATVVAARQPGTKPAARVRSAAKSGIGALQQAIAAAPGARASDIQAAADRGDLQLAVKLGAELLKAGPACPETLHLLAVISDAAGDHAAAAEYYRKTLYLEPDHHEALTHLALLLDRKGDAFGARRMRDRAQRIDARRGR